MNGRSPFGDDPTPVMKTVVAVLEHDSVPEHAKRRRRRARDCCRNLPCCGSNSLRGAAPGVSHDPGAHHCANRDRSSVSRSIRRRRPRDALEAERWCLSELGRAAVERRGQRHHLVAEFGTLVFGLPPSSASAYAIGRRHGRNPSPVARALSPRRRAAHRRPSATSASAFTSAPRLSTICDGGGKALVGHDPRERTLHRGEEREVAVGRRREVRVDGGTCRSACAGRCWRRPNASWLVP